jgi:hypothetical protein
MEWNGIPVRKSQRLVSQTASETGAGPSNMPTASIAIAAAAEPATAPNLPTTATNTAIVAQLAAALDLPNTVTGTTAGVQPGAACDLPTMSRATTAVATIAALPAHAPHVSNEDLLPHGPTL